MKCAIPGVDAPGDVRDGHVSWPEKGKVRGRACHGSLASARSRLGLRAGRRQQVPARGSEGRRHAAGQACRKFSRELRRVSRWWRMRWNSRTRWNSNDPMRWSISRSTTASSCSSVAVVLFVWGIIAFKRLPVEAYPDVANTWVQVITQWPGRAAEEVEQQITIPDRNSDERNPAPSARALGVAGGTVGGESDLRRRFRQRLGPPESAGAAVAR